MILVGFVAMRAPGASIMDMLYQRAYRAKKVRIVGVAWDGAALQPVEAPFYEFYRTLKCHMPQSLLTAKSGSGPG
jgi:hypothetical protein